MKFTRTQLKNLMRLILETTSNVASAGASMPVDQTGLAQIELDDVKSVMGSWGNGTGLEYIDSSNAFYLADTSSGVGSDLTGLMGDVGAGSTGDIGEATIGHIAGASEGYTSFMNLNMATPRVGRLSSEQLAGRSAGAFLGCDLYMSKGNSTDFRNIQRTGSQLDLSESGNNIFASAKASATSARGRPSRQKVKFSSADQINIAGLVLYHWLYQYLTNSETLNDESIYKFSKNKELKLLQTGYDSVETLLSIYKREVEEEALPLKKLDRSTASKDYKDVASVVSEVLNNIGIETVKIRFDAYNLSGFAHGEGKDWESGAYKNHKPIFVIEKKDLDPQDTIINVDDSKMTWVSGNQFSGESYNENIAVVVLDQNFTAEQAEKGNLYLYTRAVGSKVQDQESDNKKQSADVIPYDHTVSDPATLKLQSQRFFEALNIGKDSAANLSSDFEMIESILSSSTVTDSQVFFSADPRDNSKLQQAAKFTALISEIERNPSIKNSALVIENFIIIFSEELSALAGDEYGIEYGPAGREQSAGLAQTVFDKETSTNFANILSGELTGTLVFPTVAAQLRSMRSTIQENRAASENHLSMIDIVLPDLDSQKKQKLYDLIISASVKCFNILLVAEIISKKITHADATNIVGGLIMDNKNIPNTGYENLDTAKSFLYDFLNVVMGYLNTNVSSEPDNVINLTEPMGSEERTYAALTTNSDNVMKAVSESSLYEKIILELLNR